MNGIPTEKKESHNPKELQPTHEARIDDSESFLTLELLEKLKKLEDDKKKH